MPDAKACARINDSYPQKCRQFGCCASDDGKNTQSLPKKENKIARRWRALFEGLSESTAAAPSVNHDCRMNLAFVYPDFD